jgi:hypothetical protein
LITYSINSLGLIVDIDLSLRLSQQQSRKLPTLTYQNTTLDSSSPNDSYLWIMELIANFLLVKVTIINRFRTTRAELGYLVTCKSHASRTCLINYLNNSPFMSSKRLDYLS